MAIRAMDLGVIRVMEKRAIPRTAKGATQWPETLVTVTAPLSLRASKMEFNTAGRWLSPCLWRRHWFGFAGTDSELRCNLQKVNHLCLLWFANAPE
jgi:hypothetical protein